MPIDPIIIRIQTDVRRAVQELDVLRNKYAEFAKAWIKITGEAGKAMVNLTGDRLVAQANAYMQVIERLGGVSKLTQAEQAKVNKLLGEAIAKYQALGEKVPPTLQKIFDQTKQISQQKGFITDKAIRDAQQYADEIAKLGRVSKMTAAEQAKALKAIDEGIAKMRAIRQPVSKELLDLQAELRKIAQAKIFDDAAIRRAREFEAAIKAIGGVTKLTATEMAKANKTLVEAAEKYRVMGEKVPQWLNKLLIATTKVAQTPLYGEGTIRKAEQVVAMIQRAGGHMALTAAEQQKVNKLLTEAIEKYEKLGRQVPKELEAIAKATSRISRNQQLLGPMVGEAAITKAKEYVRAIERLGGVQKLTNAEQVRFNKVLGEAIEKMRRMGQEIPQNWAKLYKETQQGTNQLTKFFDSLFFKIAGGASVAQLLANAIQATFRKTIDLLKAGWQEFLDLIAQGSAMQNIQTAFQGLAQGIGIIPEELMQRTRDLTKGLISDFKIMESANRAMLFGLKLTAQEFAEMTEAGIVLGRAMNLGPEQSVQRLILALGRMSPRILDDLGIIVKLTEANERWAAAHGKTVRAMTGSEKVLAFQELAMIKIREAMQHVGDINLTLQDRITQLGVKWENFRNNLGLAINQSGVFRTALEGISDSFSKAFGPANEEMISHTVRVLEELAILFVRLAGYASQFAAILVKDFAIMLQETLATWRFLEQLVEQVVNLITFFLRMVSQVPGIELIAPDQIKHLALLLTGLQKIRDTSKEFRPSFETGLLEAAKLGRSLEELAEGFKQTAIFMEAARGAREKGPTPKPGAPFQLDVPEEVDEDYEDAVESLEKRIAKLRIALEGANKAQISNEEIMRRHGAAIRNIVTDAAELNVALPKVITNAYKAVVLPHDLAEIIRDGGETARAELKRIQKDIQDDQKQAAAYFADQMLENLNLTATAAMDSFAAGTKSEKEQLEHRIRLIRADMSKRRGLINMSAAGAKEALIMINELEKQLIDDATQEYIDALEERALHRETWWKAFGDIFQQIPELIKDAFTGGGGLGGALKGIGTLFGQKLGEQLFSEGALPNMISQGMSKLFGKDFAANFATMLGPLGGVLGTFAVEGVSRLVEALTDTTAEKLMRDVGRDWGVNISEGLADKIAKDADEMMDRQAATLLHINEIIEEAGGINRENVEIWTERARDLFVMLSQGRLTASQVAGVLEDLFPDLIEQIPKSTGLASEKLVEMITLTQQFGLEVKAVEEFIEQMTEKAIEGFNAIAIGMTFEWLDDEELAEGKKSIKELTEEAKDLAEKITELEGKQYLSGNQRVALRDYRRELEKINKEIEERRKKIEEGKSEADPTMQQDFDRLARLATVAFDAAMASGMNILDIIEKMGPGLDKLNESAEAFGFTMTGKFADISAIRNWVEENEELAGAIGGVNDMAVGLANTNKMSAEAFADLSVTTVELFNKMREDGLTANQAMMALQPTLQVLWELQKRNGYQFDENTAKLIAEAEAAGKVGEQFKSNEARIVDATERIATGMEKLLKAMGINIDETEDGADDVRSSIGGIGDELTDQEQVWRDWGNSAIGILHEVQAEVDRLNFGSSPGGLKEIPILLTEGEEAMYEFQDGAVTALNEVFKLIGEIGGKDPFGMPRIISEEESERLRELIGEGPRIVEPWKGDLEELINSIPKEMFPPDWKGWQEPRYRTMEEQPTIIVQQGAVQISTWTIEETEKIERAVTEAVLRGIAKNDMGAYTTTQNLVRGMVHGY